MQPIPRPVLPTLRALGWAALLLPAAFPARAMEFRDVASGVAPQVHYYGYQRPQSAFQDFDGDGDLDMLTVGIESQSESGDGRMRVYRNTGGEYSLFTDFSALGASRSWSADWADLDHDGYPEVVTWTPIEPDSGSLQVFTYDPSAGQFRPKAFAIDFSGILETPLIEFADIDQDGFADLFLAGKRKSDRASQPAYFTRILRNASGAGLTIPVPMPFPAALATTAWGDMDQDGDLDLFLAGLDSASNGSLAARVLRYDELQGRYRLFAAIDLEGAYEVRSAALGDYFTDGYWDLAIATNTGFRFFWNTGRTFERDMDVFQKFRDQEAMAAREGSVSFGDPDGDGDADLLLSGQRSGTADGRFTRIYENDGDIYLFDWDVPLPPYWNSSTRFADFDGDGHDDLVLAGTTTNNQGRSGPHLQLLRNIRGEFEMSAPLDSLPGDRVRWADYDGDLDMDLVACKAEAYPTGYCRLFRNEAGALVRVPAAFDALAGDPEWGDFDGDGRVDLLLAGSYGAAGRLRLFRNTGAGFAETEAQSSLPPDSNGIGRTSARFGDFDRDGDADLLVWGDRTVSAAPYDVCFSDVLLNQGGGSFQGAGEAVGMPGVCNGELEWGDYDRDGDLDVLLSGSTEPAGSPVTAVYRNDGGSLVNSGDPILGLNEASVAWGDFDQDGDLDFAIAGVDNRSTNDLNVPTTWVYRLVGGRFEEFWKGFGLARDLAWVDYDHDGDLDLLNSGRHLAQSGAMQHATILMRNNGQLFTSFQPFTSLLLREYDIDGSLDLADYDNDGDVDLAVMGKSYGSGTERDQLRIYRSSLLAPNALPGRPAGLASALAIASADLSWNRASDAETQGAALRYNLRVGTSPGAGDVVSAAADPAGGRRFLTGPGYAGAANSLRLTGLRPGTYYWSVQTVDNQGGASAFSSEQSFSLGLPAPQLLEAVPGPGTGKVTLRWHRLPQSHFQRYYLHYGTDPDPVARLDSLSRPGDTVLTVGGLENGRTWHFRLTAVDQGGNASPYSNPLTAVPDGTPPAIPTRVAALPGDRSITLTWSPNQESDFLSYLVYQRVATGQVVKIDSIPSASASAKTITGLKNGTPYSFLVVAVDRILNYSGFSEEAVAIPAYLLTPSAPAVDFGRIPLAGRRDAILSVRNSSALPVAVDSIRFVNPAFALAGIPAAFPAQAETSLTLTFAPDRAAGGDFAGLLRLYYGGSPVPLEIDLSGSAVAAPHCRIEKIVPADLPWDTATAITFLASANDSDNAGVGDRITAYLWSSSLAGPLAGDASGFTLRPDQLGLGAHEISLRVVDNEGDTSLAARSGLTIRSLKPLARIESVTPAGLILRGADEVRIRSAAYDRDEGAGPGRPDLADFSLHSTLQGRLSGSPDTVLDPSALALGVHGFYAVAVDDEGDTSVSDTSWVPVQAGVGLALLVAGTDFDDNRYFYENIAPNCNWVYSQLRQRGFTDSLITYFNPVGWQSIGGDYHRDSRIVDVTEMTVANLRERILGFKDRVRSGVPLLLSFIGHGGRADKQDGKFYLSPTEYLLPDSLDAWLDTYDHAEAGGSAGPVAAPIVMVFDHCFSGAFFPKLRSSTQNRVVIASSAVDRQSYFQNGRSFSYALFRQIGKGGNLSEAWVAGKAWSDANTTMGLEKANPLANADNDNSANEGEDFLRMNQIYIGGSQQGQGPQAAWKDVQLAFDEGRGTVTITAFPESRSEIDTAWFTMLPPDFEVPQAGAANPFIAGGLARREDGSYSAAVKLDPVLSGDYLFSVHGLKDGEELMPLSKRANPAPVGLTRRSGLPERYELGQNYPNPAVSMTFIPLAVTRKGRVELRVHGMDGRLVKTLVSGTLVPGFYRMQWDGSDAHGRRMAPGVYTYVLRSAEGMRRRTLVWGR